ncbi:hypothetical protein DCOP10_116282 [Armatimonadetes bacterium DC]|nr:hypothetical protein DCOP10_116282 [Armatimonadetes bacterium DC]
MSRLVALLTDYGHKDTYVAQVKAVLLHMCESVEFLDLTHEVPPQDIRAGAYLLSTAVPYLPEGTLVIAVVDPGVGTERRAVAVQARKCTYFAPDNGLLTLALREDPPEAAVVLDNPRFHLPAVSATFHGRDIFAPTCAHYANGFPLAMLGTPIDPASLQTLEGIEPILTPDTIRTRPLHTDHFGNVIFNLREEVFLRWRQPEHLVEVRLGERTLPLVQTFGDVPWGEPLAYFGSNRYLEVAINGGSARHQLNLHPDTELLILQKKILHTIPIA